MTELGRSSAAVAGIVGEPLDALVVRAVLFTAIPVGAALLGSVAASVHPPGRKITSVIQHGAAGVVFAAVAVELIPAIRQQSPWSAIVGFAVGIAAMLTLSALTRRLERPGRRAAASTGGLRVKLGLLAATGIDILIDGLVLGAGFAAATRVGMLLTVALALELMLIGLANAAALAEAGAGPVTAIATVTGLGLLSTGGTAVGVLALGGASPSTLAVVLSFGAVALMYLVTEELLTEAHEVAETPWATAAFFLGFLSYLIIAELMRTVA